MLIFLSGCVDTYAVTYSPAPVCLPADTSSATIGEIIYDIDSALGVENADMLADLNYWKTINSSVYALIKIEEYDIYYPVIEATESNSQWLRTDIFGNYSISGSVFLDVRSDPELTPIKLIHGHNMKDGSMFSNVPNYLTLSSCKDAPKIQLYSENGLFYYRVFAVLSVNSTEEAFPIESDVSFEDLDAIVSELKSRSLVPGGDPTSHDILLLNTCWYGESGTERNLHCIVAASRE